MSPQLLCLLCCVGCGRPDNSYKPAPPPEVSVAHPVQQSVTEFIEENGETEVVQHADVRARVRGFLEEIRFEPGQRVNEGDVLYIIERDQYEAAVNAAQASLAAAQAGIKVAESQVGVAEVEVTRAELEYKRIESLLAREAATQSQFDDSLAARDAAVATHQAALAQVATASAARDQAAADLERAQLDLDYTQVQAPISGRITKTEIKQGNLVEVGDLMCAVVDRSRVYVNFSISDRTLLRLQQVARERGEVRNDDEQAYRSTPAFLHREIDDGYPFQGHLDYVDQEGVDQSTGTYFVRAVFENPEDLILPGLFVRVRVPVGQQPSALLIPQLAELRDQQGSYVLTLDANDKVQRTAVSSGATYDGMVVVDQGLSADDRVLLDGTQRVRPGLQVSPIQKTLSAVPMMTVKLPTEDADPASGQQGDRPQKDPPPGEAAAPGERTPDDPPSDASSPQS